MVLLRVIETLENTCGAFVNATINGYPIQSGYGVGIYMGFGADLEFIGTEHGNLSYKIKFFKHGVALDPSDDFKKLTGFASPQALVDYLEWKVSTVSCAGIKS